MSRQTTLKHWLRVAGRLAALLGLAFVTWQAIQSWTQLRDAWLSTSLSSVGIAIVLYSSGALLLALAWPLLLRGFDSSRVPIRPLFVLHLQAQLSKYLPGGVLHFAQRHLASRSLEIPHHKLLLATVVESLLLVIAAGLFASALGEQPRLATLAPWLPTAMSWLLPALVGLWLLAWLGHGCWATWSPRASRWFWLPVVSGLDLLFFGLASTAFWLLLPQPAMPLLDAASWLCLAWMAGYLIPGAPGGLGVREAVLLLGLGPVLGEASALAAALLYRIVTMVSDALCAALGYTWGRS
ncbi:MAG: lysylphosphatidylglycerol synthase domain-containing protein [Pseudoxanthomonas sp.]